MLGTWQARFRYVPPSLLGHPVHTRFHMSVNTISKWRPFFSTMEDNLKSHWLLHIERIESFCSKSKPLDDVYFFTTSIASPSIGMKSQVTTDNNLISCFITVYHGLLFPYQNLSEGLIAFHMIFPKSSIKEGCRSDKYRRCPPYLLIGETVWEFTSREVGFHWKTRCFLVSPGVTNTQECMWFSICYTEDIWSQWNAILWFLVLLLSGNTVVPNS